MPFATHRHDSFVVTLEENLTLGANQSRGDGLDGLVSTEEDRDGLGEGEEGGRGDQEEGFECDHCEEGWWVLGDGLKR